ncbi:digeranylgeranylglyceryl phosphate synthase [Filimonas sp.]|nr:digeranylgeranylglyceryl phosphate synthase [Filimonas sp.]
MLKVKAMMTLIRLPNLVFIFLTQVFAWYALILPVVKDSRFGEPVLSNGMLILLAFSTVIIAAAGYMINDYFDIGIDLINKPERVTIEKIFKRRTVIVWHILLNILALLMAGYIAYHSIRLRYLGIQLFSILLLLFYSTTFKRKLIIGNLVIAVLTALSLLTVAAYEPMFPIFQISLYSIKIYWLYVLFAFLVTFCREVVKDIEDIKGDDARQCKTIPLVWGIQAAKNFVYGLIVVLLLLLFSISFTQYESGYRVIFVMSSLALALIFVSHKVRQATHTFHFHSISTYLKWITLAGILSMLCFTDIINTH